MKSKYDLSIKSRNYKSPKTSFILSILVISLTLIITSALAAIVHTAQGQNIPVPDICFDYDDISDFPDRPIFPNLLHNFDRSFPELPNIGDFDLS